MRELLRPAAGLAPDEYDVVVIGSGMGGLCSGLILAKEGFKVLVLEQHYRPGGCLHRFFRKKVPFDTGFHYIGGVHAEGTFARYLRFLGVYDKLSFHALDPDGFDVLQFPELTFRVPNGWGPLVARLDETFPAEREGIATFAAVCQRICAESFAYSFQRPPETLGEHSQTTLGSFMRRLGMSERLKAVLAAQSMLYGMPPDETPLELHALVIDSMLQGAVGIDGGGDALAKALVDAIRAHGGVVRTRARVDGLGVGDGRVTHATLQNGEVVRGRCFISDAHPRATLDLLPEGVMRPAYVHRVRDLKDGISCIGGYFTFEQDELPPQRHNLYLIPGFDVEQMYRTAGFGAGHGPGRALFVTFPADRERDWRGPRVLLALGMMPYEEVEAWAETRSGARGEDYERLKDAHGAQMQGAIEERLPVLRGRLSTVEISTPLTNRDFTGSPRGAVYGLKHSMDQWGKYALHPRTRIDNLLLTGQSVLMPGVLGVTVGAFVTCSFLLGFEALFERVAQA